MPQLRVPRLQNAMIGLAGLVLCFVFAWILERWVHTRWLRAEDAAEVIWRLRVVFGFLATWITLFALDGMRRKPFLS